MHSRIILNDRLTEASKARIPGVSPLAIYGRGVFTTLAIYKHTPFLWPAHWQRLVSHASRIALSLGELSEDQIYGALLKLIEANKVETGRARITLMPSNLSSSGPWALEAAQAQKSSAQYMIYTGDARISPEEGLALTVSPFRVNTHSPLAGLKSVNYLEHILAWEEARARNFDDAVTLNERGEIVSTAMANIFWLSGGTLHTPAASSGCLEGTTRGCVLGIAAELSIPVIEGVYDLARLGDADEIFLTSSGVGVALVTAFDYHRYAIQAGSFSLRIREAFRQLTLESGKR